MSGRGSGDTITALENSAGKPESVTSPRGWKESKSLALAEFLLVGLIFYADHRGWIPISKTPELLLLGWISLRVRGLRWRDVGLTRCRSWPITMAIGIGLGVLVETLQLAVTQPILSRLLGRQPDLEFFRTLAGNWKMTVLFIILSWTLAAFGEEMVWRGYLMNRVADLLGQGRTAWVASLMIVSAAFGLAHEYQGLTGWIEESLAGLWLGLMYLGSRRNLWVPVLAHGVSDTTDMVLIFLGKMPGL